MIGSAILFGNASCKEALAKFPCESVKDVFAVTFVGKLEPSEPVAASADAFPQDGLDQESRSNQTEAKRRVRGIAKLKVHRSEFDAQAAALQSTNVVYKDTHYESELVATWCPDANKPEVPPMIVDSVVAVHGPDDAGKVVASGPGDATAAGEAE